MLLIERFSGGNLPLQRDRVSLEELIFQTRLLLPEAERERILHSLERHGWNRTATAEALGISRVTLWKKIRAFHLDEGIFRRGSRPEDQR